MTQETIGPEDAPVYTTNHRMPFARRSVNTVFFLLLILIIIGAGSYGLIYIADKESVTLFQDQETAPQDDPVEISDAVQNLSDNPDALFDKEEQDLPVQKKLQMQRGASAPNVNDFVQNQSPQETLNSPSASPAGVENIENVVDRQLYLDRKEYQPTSEDMGLLLNGQVFDDQGVPAGDIISLNYQETPQGQKPFIVFRLDKPLREDKTSNKLTLPLGQVKIIPAPKAYHIELNKAQTEQIAKMVYKPTEAQTSQQD